MNAEGRGPRIVGATLERLVGDQEVVSHEART